MGNVCPVYRLSSWLTRCLTATGMELYYGPIQSILYGNGMQPYSDKFLGDSQIKTTWRNHYPRHPIIRQDSTNALLDEDGISNLHNNWKYLEGHPPQAISACPDPNQLHSNYILLGYYK
jgi:hypothetical protein